MYTEHTTENIITVHSQVNGACDNGVTLAPDRDK